MRKYLKRFLYGKNDWTIKINMLRKSDMFDFLLLKYLIRNSILITENGISFFQIKFSQSDICRNISLNSILGCDFQRVLERHVFDLLSATIIIEESKKKIRTIKIAKQIVTEHGFSRDEEDIAEMLWEIQFSAGISAAILSHRLEQIKSKQHKEPVDSTCSELYWSLRRERFQDLYLYNSRRHTYTFIGMQLLSRMDGKSVDEIIKKYRKALLKLKAQKKLIEDFYVSEGLFHFLWIALNAEEERALMIVRSQSPAKEKNNMEVSNKMKMGQPIKHTEVDLDTGQKDTHLNVSVERQVENAWNYIDSLTDEEIVQMVEAHKRQLEQLQNRKFIVEETENDTF